MWTVQLHILTVYSTSNKRKARKCKYAAFSGDQIFFKRPLSQLLEILWTRILLHLTFIISHISQLFEISRQLPYFADNNVLCTC